MIPLSFFRHAKEAALLRRVTRTGTLKSVTDPPPGSLKEAIERARQHVAAARLQGSIRGAEARKVTKKEQAQSVGQAEAAIGATVIGRQARKRVQQEAATEILQSGLMGYQDRLAIGKMMSEEYEEAGSRVNAASAGCGVRRKQKEKRAAGEVLWNATLGKKKVRGIVSGFLNSSADRLEALGRGFTVRRGLGDRQAEMGRIDPEVPGSDRGPAGSNIRRIQAGVAGYDTRERQLYQAACSQAAQRLQACLKGRETVQHVRELWRIAANGAAARVQGVLRSHQARQGATKSRRELSHEAATVIQGAVCGYPARRWTQKELEYTPLRESCFEMHQHVYRHLQSHMDKHLSAERLQALCRGREARDLCMARGRARGGFSAIIQGVMTGKVTRETVVRVLEERQEHEMALSCVVLQGGLTGFETRSTISARRQEGEGAAACRIQGLITGNVTRREVLTRQEKSKLEANFASLQETTSQLHHNMLRKEEETREEEKTRKQERHEQRSQRGRRYGPLTIEECRYTLYEAPRHPPHHFSLTELHEDDGGGDPHLAAYLTTSHANREGLLDALRRRYEDSSTTVNTTTTTTGSSGATSIGARVAALMTEEEPVGPLEGESTFEYLERSKQRAAERIADARREAWEWQPQLVALGGAWSAEDLEMRYLQTLIDLDGAADTVARAIRHHQSTSLSPLLREHPVADYGREAPSATALSRLLELDGLLDSMAEGPGRKAKELDALLEVMMIG